MYYAFAKEYSTPITDLNTEVEIFPVSSATPDRGTTVYAIWDTGASQTVITNNLMARLDLIPIETELVHGINSKQGDFHISNFEDCTLFSFVIPSLPERIDLVEKADKLNNQAQ
jgi:hypothetical protein